MENPINPTINKIEDNEIPAHILAEFSVFLKEVPAERLNKGLRKLLFDYLFFNMDNLPIDFKEILTDLYWLHELLDEIQQERLAVN